MSITNDIVSGKQQKKGSNQNTNKGQKENMASPKIQSIKPTTVVSTINNIQQKPFSNRPNLSKPPGPDRMNQSILQSHRDHSQNILNTNHTNQSRSRNKLISQATEENNSSLNSLQLMRTFDMSTMKKLNTNNSNLTSMNIQMTPIQTARKQDCDNLIINRSQIQEEGSIESNEIIKPILIKREKSQDSGSIYDKLYQHSKKWNQFRNQWNPPDNELEELKECTFKPNVSKSPVSHRSTESQQHKRIFQEFLKDQKTLEQLREHRLEKLKERFINEQLTKIEQSKTPDRYKSNESRKIIAEEFYERVMNFQDQRNQKMKNLQQKYYSEMKFHPKTSRQSVKESFNDAAMHEIVERLYSHKRGGSCSSIHETDQNKSDISINQKSLQYICNKLHKDFENALESENIDSLLTKEQYLSIMKRLGYSEKGQSSQNKSSLINQLWNEMVNKNQLVHIMTLKIFLTAIEGIFFNWMVEIKHLENQENIVFLENQYQAQRVSKHYFPLLQNRRRYIDYIRNVNQSKRNSCIKINRYQSQQEGGFSNKKSTHQHSHSYVPLSARSQCKTSMNQSTVDQSLLQKVEQLYGKQKQYEANKEKRKSQLIQKELEQCTFAPKINDSKRYLSGSRSPVTQANSGFIQPQNDESVSYLDCFTNLYLQNPLTQRSKEGIPQEEIEYQRAKTECTFVPALCEKSRKILQKNKSNKHMKSLSEINYNQVSPKNNNITSLVAQQTQSPRIIHKSQNQKRNSVGNSKQVSSKKVPDSINKQTIKENILSQGFSIANTNSLLQQSMKQSQLPKAPTETKRTPQHSNTTTKRYQVPHQKPFSPPRQMSPTNDSMMEAIAQQYSQMPMLFLDVNMGKERVERLIIQDGDNIELIVQQFCTAHKLSERKKSKLLKAIYKQLSNHLPSIIEED